MFNLISILVGICAAGAAVLSLLPQFGMANWLIVPLAALGTAIGLLSRADGGRKLNTVVLVIGVGRLVMNAGWF